MKYHPRPPELCPAYGLGRGNFGGFGVWLGGWFGFGGLGGGGFGGLGVWVLVWGAEAQLMVGWGGVWGFGGGFLLDPTFANQRAPAGCLVSDLSAVSRAILVWNGWSTKTGWFSARSQRMTL